MVSKRFYIKVYEINSSCKLCVPFITLKFKYIIQYNNGQMMHNFNRYTKPIGVIIIIEVIHIRIYATFINVIVENSHI